MARKKLEAVKLQNLKKTAGKYFYNFLEEKPYYSFIFLDFTVGISNTIFSYIEYYFRFIV
jgi:hypothetical protein